MPSLLETQKRFAHAVLGLAPDGATAFIAGSPARAAERIAIYRRTLFANYRKALAATFPTVQRLLGAAPFHAAADAFVRAYPSTSGDLNSYGDRFAKFLDSATDAPPYLPDVARLEWAIDEAHRAPEAPRVADAVLAAFSLVAPERLPALRLRLDPSCRLLTSRFQVLQIWKAHQPNGGEAPISLDRDGDTLLVRRDASGVSLERNAAGEHAWLVAISSGAALSEAIEAGQNADAMFDLGVTLRDHIAAGTIVGVVDDVH
jgi:uncharacterized protein